MRVRFSIESRILRRTLLRCIAVLAVWLVSIPARPVGAGGGPENVLLVVNPNSRASMTIANHYIQFRGIPADNVLYVPWDPARDTTDVDTFRQEILRPVMRVALERHFTGRIDYIVYSADFPWAVNTRADVDKFLAAQRAKAEKGQHEETGQSTAADPKPDKSSQDESPQEERAKSPLIEWPKQLTPVGSLNGLTYLWQWVLRGNPAAYMALNANFYMRRATPDEEQAASIAFRSTHFFRPSGQLLDPDVVAKVYRELHEALQRARAGEEVPVPVQLPGSSYMLSTMLGVTAGRGNTVEEILHYLRRSAAADGTHPQGTIYFLRNNNVRSKTRRELFAAAVEQLLKLGVDARILAGVMPKDKPDVQGVMLGTPLFNWPGCGSTILPGAICEHLTSFGGVMSAGANQTPLSEFLRHGAAGASGAVTEPYAIQAKFPVPFMHVHYARGCSLAEAFYQSVAGPYQLLIVGDPLCRPWAEIPTVRCEGVEPGATVKGTLNLEPAAVFPGESKADHFELFVDGATRAHGTPGETLALDTTRLADGYHELRVVAVESGPIETRGHRIVPVMTANHGRTIQMTVTPAQEVPLDQPILVDVESPGSIGIGVMQNTRMLARITGEKGRAEIDPSVLGGGPVRLHAIGLGKGGPETNVIAAPVEVMVRSP